MVINSCACPNRFGLFRRMQGSFKFLPLVNSFLRVTNLSRSLFRLNLPLVWAREIVVEKHAQFENRNGK